MEIIKFVGISKSELKDILAARDISGDVVYRKETAAIGRTSKEGTREYVNDSSDADCYYFACGPRYRYYRRRRSYSYCYCDSDDDCDTNDGGDASGILVFFILIFLVILLIVSMPYIISAVAVVFDLIVAGLLGLFNILTFGAYRDRFRAVRVSLPETPKLSQAEYEGFLKEVAHAGGIPQSIPEYRTSGFTMFRMGAYMLIPSLLTIPIFIALGITGTEAYAIPVITLAASLLFLWFGNILIIRKRRYLIRNLMG